MHFLWRLGNFPRLLYLVLQLLDLTSCLGRGLTVCKGLKLRNCLELTGRWYFQRSLSKKPRATFGPGPEESALHTTHTKTEGAPQPYAPREARGGDPDVWHTDFRLWHPREVRPCVRGATSSHWREESRF